MLRLIPILVLVATLCCACGTNGLPSSADGSASPSVWARLDEVDTGPGKLVPNVQQDDTAENGGGVYVALWTRPRIASGNEEFPRSICLPMSVDNHDERALLIHADFEPKAGGTRVPVPSANCAGVSAMPTRLEPEQDADGTLGFYIPAGRGRLVLSGSHNFDWYVDVTE